MILVGVIYDVGCKVTCKYEGEQSTQTAAAPEREASEDDVRHVGLDQRHGLQLYLIATDHHHLLRLLC